jgi:hypothetical protein
MVEHGIQGEHSEEAGAAVVARGEKGWREMVKPWLNGMIWSRGLASSTLAAGSGGRWYGRDCKATALVKIGPVRVFLELLV